MRDSKVREWCVLKPSEVLTNMGREDLAVRGARVNSGWVEIENVAVAPVKSSKMMLSSGSA